MCHISREPATNTVQAAKPDSKAKFPGLAAKMPISEKLDVTRTIATPLPDGYWMTILPFHVDSEYPDIIGYGLGVPGAPRTVKFFINPLNTGGSTTEWSTMDLQSFDFPVGMSYADMRGVNLNDIVICDRYGPTIYELYDENTQEGGGIYYLVNPGKRTGVGYWEKRKIGHATGMHRLQVGNFTKDQPQVLCFPVISKGGDFWSPTPVVFFDSTYGEDYSQGPQSWTRSVPFPDQFRIIHDCQIVPKLNEGLDSVLVSGREGIMHLYWDTPTKAWTYTTIATGIPKELGTPKFWGSGTVDYGRIGDDDFGYICAVEGFHGNTVTLYLKTDDAPKGYASLADPKYWTRHIIDSFGPLDEEWETGTLHHIRKLPLLGDVEPFAVAAMGEPIGMPENQGIFMYVPIDIKKLKFKKVQVHGESAARIALGTFSVPGQLELASISYYVPGYHTGPDPTQVRISTLGATNFGLRK